MQASTSAAVLDATRPEVQRLLLSIPNFLGLTDAERAQIARDTVKICAYMADPGGVRAEIAERGARGDLPPVAVAFPPAAPGAVQPAGTVASPPVAPAPIAAAQAAPVAGALADPPSAVEQTKQALAKSPGFAGKDFQAGGVNAGTEAFGQLVQKVDFPKFVGGLIKNVFQAIVESSIEQMRAYGELVANVAKTTDQFMRDNIGEGAGRDYLADAYPDALSVGDASGDSPPRLQPQGENHDVRLAEISRDLNIVPPVTDVSDADAELRLVTAARLQMAKSRQQLLSSMVMLGINRIVVTDGSINAKVVFDMRAEDKAKRHYTASMNDTESQRSKQAMNMSYGAWFSPVKVGVSDTSAESHVATVGSAVDETSESKAEVKAKLSGEVRVNFKSDYLPLEKMATPEMMSTIQGNSTPYNPNAKALPTA